MGSVFSTARWATLRIRLGSRVLEPIEFRPTLPTDDDIRADLAR